MNIKIIKNADIYTPYYIGKKDILVAGEKIYHIDENIQLTNSIPHQVFDASNLFVIPGLIDSHVHIAGAGGEGGPSSRTPEIQLNQILESGITTVIGLLGTDGITRNIESVLMKSKSLNEKGISSYIMTGSYQFPIPTITGDSSRDITLIQEVIGIGEVAISDHRCSNPTVDELAKLSAKARVAGMLAGKSGIVNIHLGDSDEYDKNPTHALKPIYDVCNSTMVPIKQFVPTHCNRNVTLCKKAIDYCKSGGYVDFTTSLNHKFKDITKASKSLRLYLENNVNIENITFSSDGNGSLPKFDSNGDFIGLKIASLKSLYKEVMDSIKYENIPIEKAIQIVTSNPARIYKLFGKGFIKEGFDADIIMIDKDYEINTLFSKGNLVIDKGNYIYEDIFK
jgi:beta-aspartyl-dipeptidase (metallo-type)